MKKYKAILALVLVAALFVTLFAACAAEEKPATGDTQPPAANTETNKPADTDKPAEDGDPYANLDPSEYTDLVMHYFDLRMLGGDYGEHIVQAVNELVGPRYGLKLDINFITIGDWNTKTLVAISGGERIDIMPAFSMYGINLLYNNTQVMEIGALLEEYAPDALEIMQDFMVTYQRNGGTYGVPTKRGIVTNGYIVMRKDILDELGLTEKARNLSSWSEYEEILAAVTEAYKGTGLWAVGNSSSSGYGYAGAGVLRNGDAFADTELYDYFADPTYQIYTDKAGNISWVHDDPRVEEAYQRMAKWQDMGWAWPDSSLDMTHGDELMKQGVQFSTIQSSEYGIETTKGRTCGYELICPMTYTGLISTGTLTSWGICVPITAEEPEAACRFINALYTDAELMNLLIRGVEGVDYEMQDGQVVQNADGGFAGADWVFGNNLLLKPLFGNGADYYEQIQKINDAGTISYYLGFTLDTSELQLEVANLSAVYDQYNKDMVAGNYTPESYQEFREKLITAGVYDYLDAVQKQLDAWMAANK